MARWPAWTDDEWVLLLDLYRAHGPQPPSEVIERLHIELRAIGEVSDDPRVRDVAQRRGYRSVDGVWAQFSLVKALAEGRREADAPRRLRDVWPAFRRDPQRIHLWAEEIRARVGEQLPLIRTDAHRVQVFLAETHDLIDEVVRVIQQLPKSNLSEDATRAYVAAWDDLQGRPILQTLADELEDPDVESSLELVGLAGSQLAFKLSGWGAAYREWRVHRTLEALKRAFQYANVVLGSLEKALLGPGLDLFKEFKESTELVLDQAVPRGGFLPAPQPVPTYG